MLLFIFILVSTITPNKLFHITDITLKHFATLTKSEHPSLQFMQQHRKFEGRIPKIIQQSIPMTTISDATTTTPATSSTCLTANPTTEANTIVAESAPNQSDISSQNQNENEQTIIYSNMLPAVSTLNGIPSHHQTQYITMQAPTTTLSQATHTTSSPNTTSTTDGTVYQYKSEIICDSQLRYHQQQQQNASQSRDSNGKLYCDSLFLKTLS